MNAADWKRDLIAAGGLFLLSTLIVEIGFAIAGHIDPLDAAFRYDSGHYLAIVEHGYSYDPERPSNIAFFPGYPLLAKLVTVFGSSPRQALWRTSQFAWIVALALFSSYLRTKPASRWPALLALALWPVGICFNVAYSEGLLLAFLALLMLGFVKRWSFLTLTLIAGAATGVRAVGVAASVAVLVHLAMSDDPRRWRKGALLAPVSVWGLFAFMIYQAADFGQPLAFLQAQRHWSVYAPEHCEPYAKALRLAIAEPVWGSYVPGSQRHWSRFNDDANPLLGSAFWNPALFVLAAVVVLLGSWKRLLTREEAILGLGLLAIPYVSRADEQSMLSHARFAAVALPMYVVIGHGLMKLPLAARIAVYALLAAGLGLWAMLFAQNRPLL
jgi:hypothetical protein